MRIARSIIVALAVVLSCGADARGLCSVLCGGANLWTPLNLGSALVAWWDASYTPSLTFNTTNISAWTDRKSGIVASQATGADQPAWSATAINGKPGLTFNGTSDYLTFSPTAAFPIGSSASTIYVSMAPSTGATSAFIAYGSASTASARSLGQSGTSEMSFFTDNNDFVSTITWPTSISSFGTASVPAGASPTISLQLNDGSAQTASRSTLSTTTSLGTIGGFLGMSLLAPGIMQQIVITNIVMSTCQQQKMVGWESWYTGKNGSNLSVSNPYKNSPPLVGGAC